MKIFFSNKEEIKTFSNERKRRENVTSRTKLKESLREFRNQWNWNQENSTYNQWDKKLVLCKDQYNWQRKRKTAKKKKIKDTNDQYQEWNRKYQYFWSEISVTESLQTSKGWQRDVKQLYTHKFDNLDQMG